MSRATAPSPPSARSGHGFEAEVTQAGVQTLVSGIAPITPAARLAMLANAPLLPRRVQRPAEEPALSACLAGSRRGLFDVGARNQLEMF